MLDGAGERLEELAAVAHVQDGISMVAAALRVALGQVDINRPVLLQHLRLDHAAGPDIDAVRAFGESADGGERQSTGDQDCKQDARHRRIVAHPLYFGTASTGDSNAMKRTQGTALVHEPLCARFAGPYA